MDYYKSTDSLETIYNKLDNCSLQKLYQHFFFWIVCCDDVPGRTFIYSSLDLIKKTAQERKFDIWKVQPEEKTNPVAPLQRYKGESWLQHPF